MLNLSPVLESLAKRRPIFHSEADFQFALAWEIQGFYPDAELRLEYPITTKTKERIDILVRYSGCNFPIELKYATKGLGVSLNHEVYNLKSHDAGEITSYDFLKDICRLEQFANTLDDYKAGFAIWITNDPYHWKVPLRENTASLEFRTYDGAKK